MQSEITILDEVKVEPVSLINFPSLNERVKATTADAVFLILFMILFGFIFDNMENPPDVYRKLAFIFVFGIYNPLFVALFGGTLGHFVVGLRVKRNSERNRNVFILIAVIRYAIKLGLGVISFFTISNNSERKAIHDIVTGSIVLYKSNSRNK